VSRNSMHPQSPAPSLNSGDEALKFARTAGDSYKDGPRPPGSLLRRTATKITGLAEAQPLGYGGEDSGKSIPCPCWTIRTHKGPWLPKNDPRIPGRATQ